MMEVWIKIRIWLILQMSLINKGHYVIVLSALLEHKKSLSYRIFYHQSFPLHDPLINGHLVVTENKVNNILLLSS